MKHSLEDIDYTAPKLGSPTKQPDRALFFVNGISDIDYRKATAAVPIPSNENLSFIVQ